MKKLLLTIALVATGSWAFSQVVCAGVSPASIQGNYEFGIQANCGLWPGETDDATWGVWNGGLDFNNPGDFILDTLMLVEDGTPGTNPQGNPISQEGCNPLINDLTGKIAVVYRNTCWFSSKIAYAQQAGAVAVIVINREDGITNMLANTDPLNGPLGTDCNIPAVFISDVDGAALVSEMQNGPVVMFIGNKLGAFPNDVGAVKGEYIISDYAGANSAIYDGFTPGIQIYNYGSAPQNNVMVTATIDGPLGQVYTSTVGPLTMASGDTIPIFAGNTDEFTAWAQGVGNYDDGDYTLTYDIDLGVTDDFAFDNNYTSDFKIQPDVISLARIDASNEPLSNSYPSNSTTEYSSCMMFQEPNASNIGVQGVYFVPHTDTSVNQLEGAEIFVNAYQWDDGWTDLNDPGYTFDPATQDGFQNLNLITFTDYFPASDNEVDQVAYAEFGTPFVLQNGVRYLFCLQTFESTTISFGYDGELDYGANYSIYAQPISPVMVDGSTYAAGWSGVSATSIALRTFDPAELGLEATEMLPGSAYPNPSNDIVTISVGASGSATLIVTDVSGKEVSETAIILINGKTEFDLSSFDTGLYIFSVQLEDGQTSQFNVVKK